MNCSGGLSISGERLFVGFLHGKGALSLALNPLLLYLIWTRSPRGGYRSHLLYFQVLQPCIRDEV